MRSKMLVFAAVAVLGAVTVGVVGTTSLQSTRAGMRDVTHEHAQPSIILGEAALAFARFRRQTVLAIANTDGAKIRAANESAAKQAGLLFAALDRFESSGATPDAKADVRKAREQYQAVVSLWTDELQPRTLTATTAQQTVALLADYDARFTVPADAITKFVDEGIAASAKEMSARVDSSEKTSATALVALWVGVGVTALVLFGFGLWVARIIGSPIGRVRDALEALSRGDLTHVARVESRDEVGQMADALARAQNALRESMATIMTSSATLAGSAEELSAVSAQVAASAEETSAQSGNAAAAAEQVSRNVQTVASGTEQMSASIREISQNSTEAVRVAQTAAEEARTANGTVAKLGDSSREIGDVVKVITSIAEQTNLLALNATIEAARAGEAGKGFAVVATEVKDLAQETARATEDIARRVEAIQADTDDAIAAIGRIAEIIEEVNSYQSTIAAAVEEQTATTGEMARSVAEAATGAGGIAGNIEYVATAAQSSSTGIVEAQRAAAELAQLSGELRELVSRFTL